MQQAVGVAVVEDPLPPRASSTARSPSSGAIERLWVVETTVSPGTFARTSTSRPTAAGSRFAVASSRRSTRGSMARQAASATRFFSPPDSSNGARARRPATSKVSAHRAARASASATPSCRGPNAISSATVGLKSMASTFWNRSATSPRKRRRKAGSSRAAGASRCPAYRTSPASGKARPSSSRRSVVFPQPFTPSTTTRSPARTSNETSSSTGRPPGEIDAWSTENTAGAGARASAAPIRTPSPGARPRRRGRCVRRGRGASR